MCARGSQMFQICDWLKALNNLIRHQTVDVCILPTPTWDLPVTAGKYLNQQRDNGGYRSSTELQQEPGAAQQRFCGEFLITNITLRLHFCSNCIFLQPNTLICSPPQALTPAEDQEIARERVQGGSSGRLTCVSFLCENGKNICHSLSLSCEDAVVSQKSDESSY